MQSAQLLKFKHLRHWWQFNLLYTLIAWKKTELWFSASGFLLILRAFTCTQSVFLVQNPSVFPCMYFIMCVKFHFPFVFSISHHGLINYPIWLCCYSPTVFFAIFAVIACKLTPFMGFVWGSASKGCSIYESHMCWEVRTLHMCSLQLVLHEFLLTGQCTHDKLPHRMSTCNIAQFSLICSI